MRKKLILLTTIVTIVVALCAFAYAADAIQYNAYEFGVKIVFGGKEIKFDLPVVTINGNTYIPLREAAEKSNINVEWNGDEQKIVLTEYPHDADARGIFNRLVGFSLPDTAEILNYDYSVDEEAQRFMTRISFSANDLEVMKNNFSGWLEDDGRFLSLYNQENDWWDLVDIEKTVCAYHSYKTESYSKSIPIRVYIAEESDNKYNLYVSYN